LSAVSSMDTTGLYVLFKALHKHNIGGGGHLSAVIDANSRRVISELHLVALQSSFDLHQDLAGALHCCANANVEGGAGIHPGGSAGASVRAARLSPFESIVLLQHGRGTTAAARAAGLRSCGVHRRPAVGHYAGVCHYLKPRPASTANSPEVRRLLHNPALLRAAAPHPGQIESALVCV
jgi:hypothetical protein